MQQFIRGKILLPVILSAILSAWGISGADSPIISLAAAQSAGPPGPGPGTTPPVPSPAPPTGTTTGTLTLTVNGAIGDGDVIAQSGQGVRTQLKEGANILNAGIYTIIANGIRRPGAIVDSLLLGAVNPPTVAITAGGAVTRIVTYTPGGGGRLWLPVSSTKTLHGFSATQLTAPNTTTPGSVTVTGAGIGPFNTAFDAAGNMYVADFRGNAVLIYTARQIAVSGSGAPTATIINGGASNALHGPVGLAFDTIGNLWVSNYGSDTLVKYGPAQLAASLATRGPLSPVPPVTIRSAAFNKLYGHAFDAAGNMWLASNAANTVIKIAKADLAVTQLVTPANTTNRTVPGILNKPRSPAFDAAGNLWVANSGGSQVVKYTINPTTGTPTPTVTATLKLNPTMNAVPTGLAFDNAGNLWATDSPHGVVLKYTIASLTNGATPLPVTTITGFGAIGGVLFAFDPPPAQLPLAQ